MHRFSLEWSGSSERVLPNRWGGSCHCERCWSAGLGKVSEGGPVAESTSGEEHDFLRILLDSRTFIRYTTNMRSVVGERGRRTSEQAFEEINSILGQLAEDDLNAVPAETMGDDVIALQRIGNRVQAEVLRWLRWKCNLTQPAASRHVDVARQLEGLPLTTQAFSDGDISYTHVSLIATTAKQLGDQMEAHAEDILVTAAKELDPLRLRRATAQLRHCLQPDEVLKDANDQHERRYLYLSQTFDGMFRIDGQLDAEGGAVLETAINSVMGPPTADDNRTAAQRRADAWVDIARRQLDIGQLPQVGGQKPHLMVTVDIATLTKTPGSQAAELEWAQPIPAETARRFACDCTIMPVFMGAESHQVDAGRTSRVIPPSMRRALIARDRHCRFPGCDRPVAWTQGHHLEHWADGGPTLPFNLALLCGRHHHLTHEGGIRLEWGADGELHAIPRNQLRRHKLTQLGKRTSVRS